MISPRFAVPVAALLALALVPTVIHSYRGTTVEDGLTTAAVPAVLDGMPSSPTPRRPGWVREEFESTDWFERVYRHNGVDVTVFAARSYDAKRLYHHPELALLRAMDTVPIGTTRLDSRPDVPLHVLTMNREGRAGIAVYALLSEGGFIDNPIAFQLRTSAGLLVSGRKPLTLLMASAAAGSKDDIGRAPATQVLFSVIDAFMAQTPAAR